MSTGNGKADNHERVLSDAGQRLKGAEFIDQLGNRYHAHPDGVTMTRDAPQLPLSALQREQQRIAYIAAVDAMASRLVTLTDGLAGSNVQIAAILDRLTALDSHEDRIDQLEVSREEHYARKRLGDASLRLRVDAIERAAARTVWQRIREAWAWSGAPRR